jgi:hypothetical protein
MTGLINVDPEPLNFFEPLLPHPRAVRPRNATIASNNVELRLGRFLSHSTLVLPGQLRLTVFGPIDPSRDVTVPAAKEKTYDEEMKMG